MAGSPAKSRRNPGSRARSNGCGERQPLAFSFIAGRGGAHSLWRCYWRARHLDGVGPGAGARRDRPRVAPSPGSIRAGLTAKLDEAAIEFARHDRIGGFLVTERAPMPVIRKSEHRTVLWVAASEPFLHI